MASEGRGWNPDSTWTCFETPKRIIFTVHIRIGQEGLWSWTLSALGVVMVTKQVQPELLHEEMGMVVR